MKLLVTGTAGFIGNALALQLLERGHEVIGVDNLNDYYDVNLKKARLERLQSYSNYIDNRVSLQGREQINDIFKKYKPTRVVNLAAQAGVRYSLQNPYAYVDSNVVGFLNILECCRNYDVEHLVYASSSSVYGANVKMPFSVDDNVDHPVSLYAATKKSNELMAHSYSHLYKIPTTGLRFFTVYGPWGRPDMAYFLFSKAILSGKAIDVYNHGNMKRDFTYIDDIIYAVERVIDHIPVGANLDDVNNLKPSTSKAPYKIYNIGNNNPIQLLNMIELLEEYLGVKADKNFMPIQPGDVLATYAEVDDLIRDVGFKPSTSIEDGLKRFVDWYKSYYL